MGNLTAQQKLGAIDALIECINDEMRSAATRLGASVESGQIELAEDVWVAELSDALRTAFKKWADAVTEATAMVNAPH